MEDYEQDYENECPKCGHSPTHYRDCDHCEDGFIDQWENDPINYLPGESLIRCEECCGSGVVSWCPECGYDISLHDYVMDLKKLTNQSNPE